MKYPTIVHNEHSKLYDCYTLEVANKEYTGKLKALEKKLKNNGMRYYILFEDGEPYRVDMTTNYKENILRDYDSVVGFGFD